MIQNPHFILDYETIGQDVFNAPVINCSYFVFDWNRFTSDNPYTFNELIKVIRFAKFKLIDQIEFGYKYKKRDLDWWMDQGAEAQKQLAPSSRDVDLSAFCEELIRYLTGIRINRWWSRSNTFDPILLHRNFRDHSTREKLDDILPYWKVRDIRTYIDTQFQFENKKNAFCPIDDEELWNRHFIQHNSVHDVAADILRLQRIERAIYTD